MSMNLMAKAMSITVGNPLRKLVLIKLADNANDKGECWPSYQHIADQCEISKRSVMRHIDDLCEFGFLRKEYRPGPKGNSSNIYHLSLDGDRESLRVVTESHPPGDRVSPPPSDTVSPRTSHSIESVNEPITPIVPTGDVGEFPTLDLKPEKTEEARNQPDPVRQVFCHWQAEHNHPTAKLDDKRRKRIQARLAQGFTVGELCKAISGARFDTWLMGKNPTNKRYDGIDTLLRDAAQVEKLRDLADDHHAKAIADGQYSATTARNLDNLTRWARTDDTGAPF